VFQHAFKELLSGKHLDLEVIPKRPPYVASIQVILDLGQVVQEEIKGLRVQEGAAITTVVSIH
jgi:hypothetical protein